MQSLPCAFPSRIAAIVAGFVINFTVLRADGFAPTDAPNSPIGIAMGANPGRVAWAHDPRAATWDGKTNTPGWWADSNTHPEIVAGMLAATIRSVGGADNTRAAWEKLFQDLNQRRGRGVVGYKGGEKIAIKLNLNQSHSHGDGANASYIAPQLVRALLAELVRNAGVAPKDITFFDASRHVPSTIFDICAREYPGVHFVDYVGGDGRERAVPDKAHPLYLGAAPKPLYFPTCLTQADYVINLAGLKGHTHAGMTVCAKNHLGSVLNEDGSFAASRLHETITVKPTSRMAQQMGAYNGLVDLNGHRDTGGKTVLYLIDALYATKHNEYRLDSTCKWQSPPFNGQWTASLFASQDEVAIDSVALDFLRSEPTLRSIVVGAVDNYLHEAALAGTEKALRTYDPEKDGKPLKSLGVHEHWNDAARKQYSRNLGQGTGIELVQVGVGS